MNRIAKIAIGIGSPLIVLACITGGGIARVVFVVVTPLIPVALIALGASRREDRRRLGWVLLVLALTLEAGSIGILVLGPAGTDAPTYAGLPVATLVMLLALGVVPILLVPICYAALFGASNRS